VEYEVLWPLAKKAVHAQGAAARLPDLSGKTVGELWDYLFHGEAIYPMIREHLRARYPGIKFVDYSAFGNFFGPQGSEIVAGLGDKLRAYGCDAVISGIGA
jgi:hypothetical protein